MNQDHCSAHGIDCPKEACYNSLWLHVADMVLIYPLIYPYLVQVYKRQGIQSPEEAVTVSGELQV